MQTIAPVGFESVVLIEKHARLQSGATGVQVPPLSPFLVPWSKGYDARLSRGERGFDFPLGPPFLKFCLDTRAQLG
jgi:hypothetical protein